MHTSARSRSLSSAVIHSRLPAAIASAFVCVLLLSPVRLSAQPSADGAAVDTLVTRVGPSLDALYQDLHRQPELSGQERATAARMAAELSRLGFAVTTGVGGHGVVGVLKHGDGPTVMVRTELDALPIQEATGLPYASRSAGVMHACGHDVHMAGWVGAATVLAQLRDRWRGTLLWVAQPAEENVQGARAMIADGLFRRFPKPDFALAVHDRADLPAGKFSWVAGFTMANVDSADVTLFGKGSHGARPEMGIDPIVMAAHTVLALQALVSREKDPLEPAVLSVGSIHAGTKHNIIPDQAKLQLTVRSFSPAVRARLLAGIVRVVKAEAQLFGAPREPVVQFSEAQNATWNDPALTRRVVTRLTALLGPAAVEEGRPDMVAEDFGEFAKAVAIPSVLLRTGAGDPALWAQAGGPTPAVSPLHNAAFAPTYAPAIRTGVRVLVGAVLTLLPASDVGRSVGQP